ncbi:MAG: hypothetical protein BA869_09595 [Desulfuromonadales bacterium C00003107]|nr:MAG: hypothetical protein BA869_09595 [Desulfuromonadales bacterium C00003107]
MPTQRQPPRRAELLKTLVAACQECLHPILVEGALAEHGQVVNLLGKQVGHFPVLVHHSGHFFEATGLIAQQDHAGHAVVLEALHSLGAVTLREASKSTVT